MYVCKNKKEKNMKHLYLTAIAIMLCIATACNSQLATDVRMEVIFDNPQPRVMPLNLFGEVPEQLASELGIQTGIPSSVSVMYLEKDGKKMLFDAGNGNKDSQLMPRLGQLGAKAEDIDFIFITHLHGDHIGGLTHDGQRAFPKAKLYIPEKEWEGWMNTTNEAPKNIVALAEAYGEDLIRFKENDKLPCEIKPIPAYGHTPGHTVYQIGKILIVGDIMHGVALQMEHPEFCARFDMDQEHAIASRKEIVELAKQKGWTMYGMHFPTTEGVRVK